METHTEWPLAFDDADHRPVVVLLHAFPFDRRMWGAQCGALSASHRVLAIDLPGFGESPLHPGAGGLDAWADLLEDVLDGIVGEAGLVLVGLSMGGYVALRLAARAPDRIEGLVLADTRATADSAEARAARDQAIFSVRRHGVVAIADALLPKLLSSGAPERVVQSARELILAQRPEAVTAALVAMRDRPDSTSVLAGLEVPVMVMVGAEDTLTPPDDAEAMARTVPGSWLVRVPRAGHLANLEAPAAFNRALSGFVSTCGR